MRLSKQAILAAGVALLMLSASPVAAGASSDATGTIELAAQPAASYHQWYFGGPEGDQPIGTGVRTIVVDLGLPIQDTIDCWGKTPSEYTEVTKTEAEWLASPSIPLGDDFEIVPGETFNVTCRTGEEEYWAGFYIQWTMVAVAGTEESIALPVDPDTAWARHDTNYVSTRSPTVVPGRVGDLVHVVGPVGTFLPDERITGSFGVGDIEEDGWFDGVYFSEDATVSSDGSTLSFTLPADDQSWLDDDEPMYARFISGRTSDELPEGPSQSSRTVWYGGFEMRDQDSPQPVASTARVGLSLNTALSFQRVRATAVIDVPSGHTSEGTVTFLVDGTAVGTAEVTSASNHRASILLPRLPRGWHAVTTRFAGSDTVGPSTSNPASLRILL